jgi:hypothetical protein
LSFNDNKIDFDQKLKKLKESGLIRKAVLFRKLNMNVEEMRFQKKARQQQQQLQ